MSSDEESSDSSDAINIYECVGDPSQFERNICEAPIDFRHQDKSEDSGKLSVLIMLTSSVSGSGSRDTIHSIPSIQDEISDIDAHQVSFFIMEDGDRLDNVDDDESASAKKSFWMEQVFCSFTFCLLLFCSFLFISGALCFPLLQKYKDHNAIYQKVECTIVSASVDMGTLMSCSCGPSCSSTYPCLRVTASYTDPESGAPLTALLTQYLHNTAVCYHNMSQSCETNAAVNAQTVVNVDLDLVKGQPLSCHLSSSTPHLVADNKNIPTVVTSAHCITWSLLPSVVTLIWFVTSLIVYIRRYQKKILEDLRSQLKSRSLIMK